MQVRIRLILPALSLKSPLKILGLSYNQQNLLCGAGKVFCSACANAGIHLNRRNLISKLLLCSVFV